MTRWLPPRLRCTWHRVRLWLLQHLPVGLVAEPFAVFLALLCVISGLPTMLHLSEPSPIEALLPHSLVVGWGACLTIGGLAMLCGVFSIRTMPGGLQHVVTRVPVYRLGLRLLGISSLVYAYSVFSLPGWNAPILVTILMLFSAVTGVRLLTLGGR